MTAARCQIGAQIAVLIGTLGCRSKESPPGAASAVKPVSVQLMCDAETRTLEVHGDIALDTKLCDDEWDAIDVTSPGRVNLVKVLPERELWLRRAADRAFVEVRSKGNVTDTIDRVTALQIHPVQQAADRPDMIAITHGQTTEQVDGRTLRRRFTERGVREVSLCTVADRIGGPQIATITVEGETGVPLVVSRAECEQRALFLKFSSQGNVRLRQRDGTRIFTSVRRIAM